MRFPAAVAALLVLLNSGCTSSPNKIDRATLLNDERDRREIAEQVNWEESKIRSMGSKQSEKRIREEAAQRADLAINGDREERARARKATAEHQEFLQDLDTSLGK